MSDTGSFEERVTRALERKPTVDVPAGFAARVAGQVPVRKQVAVPAARYGLLAARIAVVVLLVALVALTMRSGSHKVIWVVLEWILCAELAGLAAWLSGVWKPLES